MITINSFVFNPFQSNTYILHDETNECVIIDPGRYEEFERKTLLEFIHNNNLKPVKLLNTHCHIDHVFGNSWVAEKYKLGLEINKQETGLLRSAPAICKTYGLNMEESPTPSSFLDEGDVVKFGTSQLKIFFTPGDSIGSICFYNEEDNFVIAGDVLFNGSIGRTDLPGGDFSTLIKSIKTKLYCLHDTCLVYPGHGPHTTIGNEKMNNPFLK